MLASGREDQWGALFTRPYQAEAFLPENAPHERKVNR